MSFKQVMKPHMKKSVVRIARGRPYLSVAFEAGLDRTRSGNGQYDGWLRKFTIAPQIGAGRRFFSRPVLRLFVTYASWSNGLRGYVGGIPFRDQTSGLTFGVQTETWW